MKQVLFRLVLVFCTALLLAQLVFMLGRQGLDRFYASRTAGLEEVYNGSHPFDVIYLGSSRTLYSINPCIVDSICGTDGFNLGMEGAELAELYMLFSGWLKKHPVPKVAVLTLDLNSFELRRRFFNPVAYYPYLDDTAVYAAMCADGRRPWLLKTLPFTQLLDYDDYTRSCCTKGWTGSTDTPPGIITCKGFLNSDDTAMTKPDARLRDTYLTVKPEAKQILEQFAAYCADKHIRLVITYAPEFRKGLQTHCLNSKVILDMIGDFAARHRLAFLRHDELDLCSDNSCFANTGHLNKKGAKVYSKYFGESLRDLLAEPVH